MTINYLSINQLLEINRSVLRKGEQVGFLYRGGMDFVVNEVLNQYEDLPIKDAIHGKTAYLWYHIANNQYFIYGNKRTAFETADVFLRVNNLTLTASEDVKHLISGIIANGLYTVESVRIEIAQYIK